MMVERTGECPVCGREYIGCWLIEAGTDRDGNEIPDGLGYIHTPASMKSRREVDDGNIEAFDGDACYAFIDGEQWRGEYPPQPTPKPSMDY